MPDPRRDVRVTDEQFRMLWEAHPHDEEFIALACRDALYDVPVVNRTGTWPKYGVRVYIDESGSNASGYLLVHRRDAKRVDGPWLDNGYCTDPDFRSENVVWDDQPDRERAMSIRRTLSHWAFARSPAKAHPSDSGGAS